MAICAIPGVVLEELLVPLRPVLRAALFVPGEVCSFVIYVLKHSGVLFVAAV